MLICTAENVTTARCEPGKRGQPTLARKDGTSDYSVWVGINQHCIWTGPIEKHIRAKGAATLLRLIADKIEAEGERFK